MNKTCKYAYCLLLLCFTLQHIAQNEARRWIFGNGCGLDFASNPPVNISSATWSTNFSTASMCDANGGLIFYTDGNTIYNNSHLIMPNGGGLAGQGNNIALILPRPGSTTTYYVFTIWAQGTSTLYPYGIYYSVVDMNLAAGQGSVVAKKIYLVFKRTAFKGGFGTGQR